MSHHLEVRLYDEVVGHIAPDEYGRLAFRFARSYLDRSPRPILGQAFEDNPERPYTGKRSGALPPFFQNLIPEGELRPLLRSRLGVPDDSDAAMLLALGRDLSGAVTVRATPGAPQRPAPLAGDAVLPTLPSDLDTNPLRFAVAGVQLKFSVVIAKERITLPAAGELGGWLAKFSSRTYSGLCENEHATMRWAARAGFDVPELRLYPADDVGDELASTTTQVLLVRRYDRAGDRRLHQEDFAQVTNLESRHKYDHLTYEKLAALTGAIVSPEAALEVVRRLAFMIAAGNGDAHLKNWSLLYREPTRPELAPVYDQVSTVAWPDVPRELALKLAGRKAFHELDAAALSGFAARARLDEVEVRRVFDETFATLARGWDDMRDTADDTWPKAHRAALLEHFRATPLLAQSPLAACRQ